MARSKSKPNESDDFFKQLLELVSINPMAAPQLEHFWQAQDDILSETETFAKNWFARRHEASRTALAVARAATEAGASDPAAVLQALTDWQAKSAERLSDDVRELIDLLSRCNDHITRAEVEAGEEGLEKATASVTAMKGEKHSVPV